jgi:hypothetical protein
MAREYASPGMGFAAPGDPLVPRGDAGEARGAVEERLAVVRQRLAAETSADREAQQNRVTFETESADDAQRADAEDDAFYASLPYGGSDDSPAARDQRGMGRPGWDGGGGGNCAGTSDGQAEHTHLYDYDVGSDGDGHGDGHGDGYAAGAPTGDPHAAAERRELEARLAGVAERVARLRGLAGAGGGRISHGAEALDGEKLNERRRYPDGGGGGGGNPKVDLHLARAVLALEAAEHVRRHEPSPPADAFAGQSLGSGLADTAHHVIGRHFYKKRGLQIHLDDVAGHLADQTLLVTS